MNQYKILLLISTLLFTSTMQAKDIKIPIEGYQLHATKQGQGSNIVVFESGFGSDASVWDTIVAQLPSTYTSITYSRAGIGKSESDGNPKSIKEHVKGLKTVLDHLNISNKVTLVGHSYGGIIVTEFLKSAPERVSGLVLVDPATLGQRVAYKKENETRVLQDDSKLLGYMPPHMASQYQKLIEQLDITKDHESYPDVPVSIITSTHVAKQPFTLEETKEGKEIWKQLHTNLFNHFNNGLHIKTSEVGHNIHKQNPELVIDAIRFVSK
ncbi:alpha/beta hydrolase [Aestuariibacter sp. AA17]|uniref:Alpha/beta hydrolase n=1 Tax=Fluctibacter corallii TaxID=2984329 RepID=A0ABT3ABU6_9ALTE|nr:alpha/beta hydrolase [Aestuariibacter sp. AA17]MCV2886089.1 alpha/beta hydrolase [Aestuariibacter sp. AA17]